MHAPLPEPVVVLLQIARPEDLPRIGAAADAMARTAHLWVLRPKGKEAAITEAQVMAAGKAHGLSLSKTLRFSDRLTGERFTWPKGR